jgi:hypothetical protein
LTDLSMRPAQVRHAGQGRRLKGLMICFKKKKTNVKYTIPNKT